MFHDRFSPYNKKTSADTAAEVIIPFVHGRLQANLIAVSIIPVSIIQA